MAADPDNAALRRRLRAARAALTRRERGDAGRRIGRALWNLPEVRHARSIALYAAIRGEVDCTEAIRIAWRKGSRVYLPVVRGRTLGFAQYARGGRLVGGRFGIPVPAAGRARLTRARALDVLIAPVVAFDPGGHRLGTGGGFYDRTLAFRRRARHRQKPVFIGVAYAFQQVDGLASRAHDVQLDAIVTPHGMRRFARTAQAVPTSRV